MFKKNYKKSYGLIVILLLFINGCASQSDTNELEDDIKLSNRSSCFNTMDIRDYRVLDRSNLIVYGRPKSRSYHLKISPPNLDESGLDMISFKSWSGRVCGFAGDELIIPDSLFEQRYSIVSVTQLDEAGHYNLMVQYGKAEPLQEIEPETSSSPEISRELDKENKESNDEQ